MDSETTNINTELVTIPIIGKLSLEGGMDSETTKINTDRNHTNYGEVVAGGRHGLGNHQHKH